MIFQNHCVSKDPDNWCTAIDFAPNAVEKCWFYKVSYDTIVLEERENVDHYERVPCGKIIPLYFKKLKLQNLVERLKLQNLVERSGYIIPHLIQYCPFKKTTTAVLPFADIHWANFLPP